MPKAAFYTFGCRLNQTESAIMAKGLEIIGYDIVTDTDSADLCVINTCTVTNQSDNKCLKKIRSVQNNNPNAIIAIVGCFSQVSSQRLLELGGIHLILGNDNKFELHKYVSNIKPSDKPVIKITPLSKKPFKIDTIGQHLKSTRVNIKIQDGCDFICSYCLIPTARGRSRSREISNIKQEVVEMAKMGVKEIVLTGVNVGTFQYQNVDIMGLLDVLNAIDGIQRIRISSIEPTTVGPEIFELMKDPDHKLVPHLHLPLQSGNNTILKKMRRRYVFEDYREFVMSAVEKVPGICIGSDIIVGFPGETEEMFLETMNRLKEIPVHYFHVFSFAERQGTTAAKIEQKVPGHIIANRSGILRNLSNEKRADFMKQSLGKTLRVLFEGNNKGSQWQGYSENYIRVMVTSDKNLKNEIKPVRISKFATGFAHGKIIE